MRNWVRIGRGFRLRDHIVALTLLSHLMITVGIPLPSTGYRSKESSYPYPCQNRPCGCLTADQCWKGDCCCFTIEEKLIWAEKNGVEPPEHVRPLVESRKSQVIPKKKKTCCSENETAYSDQPVTTSCCKKTTATQKTCCQQSNVNQSCCGNNHCEVTKTTLTCSNCTSENHGKCCEEKSSAKKGTGPRWIVGIFAQKCRGEGPAGTVFWKPALIEDSPLNIIENEIEIGSVVITYKMNHQLVYCIPPTPPPKIF